MNKKAQGISLNYIVIAAIAVLVLVIVVGFATGGLSKSFKGLKSAGPSESSVFRASCDSVCITSQGAETSALWNSSEWCTNEDSAGNNCPSITSCTPPTAGWTCPSQGA